MLEIEQIPVLSDNYVYLVRDGATGQRGSSILRWPHRF